MCLIVIGILILIVVAFLISLYYRSENDEIDLILIQLAQDEKSSAQRSGGTSSSGHLLLSKKPQGKKNAVNSPRRHSVSNPGAKKR